MTRTGPARVRAIVAKQRAASLPKLHVEIADGVGPKTRAVVVEWQADDGRWWQAWDVEGFAVSRMFAPRSEWDEDADEDDGPAWTPSDHDMPSMCFGRTCRLVSLDDANANPETRQGDLADADPTTRTA